MLINNTEFHEYFLNAQREGYEVYIGKGIALVVYEEDKAIAVQGLGFIDKVFCSFEELGPLERRLKEIRKLENRQGIKESITGKLQTIMDILVDYHETNDGWEQELYIE